MLLQYLTSQKIYYSLQYINKRDLTGFIEQLNISKKGRLFIMKKLNKTLFVLLMCTTMSAGIAVQTYAYSPLTDIKTVSISPRSDIIEWRYKVENGKLYKRQYNCTQDKWIGSWQLVS